MKIRLNTVELGGHMLSIDFNPGRRDHGNVKCEVTQSSIDFTMDRADVNGEGHHGDVISPVTVSLNGEAVAKIIKQIQGMKTTQS